VPGLLQELEILGTCCNIHHKSMKRHFYHEEHEGREEEQRIYMQLYENPS
jgi:hypothetical protein